MKFFKKCPNCRKKRLYVAKRKFYCKPVNAVLTSQEPLCGTCLSLLKKMYK